MENLKKALDKKKTKPEDKRSWGEKEDIKDLEKILAESQGSTGGG